MEIKKIQREEKRSKIISVRTFPSNCKWMNKNNISPSKLFNEALEELKNK